MATPAPASEPTEVGSAVKSATGKLPPVNPESTADLPEVVPVEILEPTPSKVGKKTSVSLVKQLNTCGRYEIYVYFVSLWPNFLTGFILLQNIFILDTDAHRCFIPGCDHSLSKFREDYVEDVVPDHHEKHTCRKYTTNIYDNLETGKCYGSVTNETTQKCLDGYVYDYANFTRSAASEWDLVCDKAIVVTVSKIIFMSGMLAAALIFGWLSDKYGRRSVYFWAPTVLTTAAIVCAFSVNIYMYTVFSFFMSFCTYGMVMVDFIIGIESVCQNWRLLAGNGYPIAFAVGQAFLTLLFWGVRNWRVALVIIALLSSTLMFYPWVIPESIRWQIAEGREEEAIAAIERAAKMNRMVLIRDSTTSDEEMETDEARKSRKVSCKQLFKHKLLRCWIVCFSIGWFTCALCYYGITWATASITVGLSFYVSFVIMSFVEIPFILMLTFMMRYIGRRILFSGNLLIAAFLCFITLAIPKSHDHLVIWFGVAAKGFISASFSLAYIYTCEVMPTITRTTGLGFCTAWARVGTVVSPVIGAIKFYGIKGPLIVIGCLLVLTGCICLILPETKGRDLPETMEDIDKLKGKPTTTDKPATTTDTNVTVPTEEQPTANATGTIKTD